MVGASFAFKVAFPSHKRLLPKPRRAWRFVYESLPMNEAPAALPLDLAVLGAEVDATIDLLRREKICAHQVWALVTLGKQQYPGGGWERVRAEMLAWLINSEQGE